MTVENPIRKGHVHTLFLENNTVSKLHCQRLKCLLPSIMKLFEEIFYRQAELFKLKFNLMSLSMYANDHRRISLPHPLHFVSAFWGYVHLRDNYGKIRQETQQQ